jgi:hypothetical protein
VLHKNRAIVGKHAQYAARLAAVRARQHLDRIVAMNIQTRHLLSKMQLSAFSFIVATSDLSIPASHVCSTTIELKAEG